MSTFEVSPNRVVRNPHARSPEPVRPVFAQEQSIEDVATLKDSSKPPTPQKIISLAVKSELSEHGDEESELMSVDIEHHLNFDEPYFQVIDNICDYTKRMDSLPKVSAGPRLNPDRSNFSIPSSSQPTQSPKASDNSPHNFLFTQRATQQNMFVSSFAPLYY